MKTIEGHDVKIFTDRVEDSALEQIARLLSIEVFGGCKIRIMPDVHAGAGCVIGFTGDLNQAITIRTFVSRNGELWMQAGGGIVAASDEERELQEVNNKLGALRKAVEMAEEI